MKERKNFYVCFIGEGIFAPEYQNYVAGRLEIYDKDNESGYDVDEYRVFTLNNKEFNSYIDSIDMRSFTKKQLLEIKNYINENFNILYEK